MQLLLPVFRRVQRGEAEVVVSVITEAELLVRPLGDGNFDAVERVGDLLSEDGFRVVAVDRRIARRAAALRAEHRLGLPDAIIAATAIVTNCEAVISNDSAWQRLDSLPLVSLDQLARSK